MKIAVSSDHAGFLLKQDIAEFLQKLGHEVLDLGTNDESPVDYPDFAEKIGLAIIGKEAERGVLICGSGVGANIAVNKITGVRAGICHDTYSAHQGVEHDDMNILVVGARIIGIELAHEIVKAFLGANFTNEERHVRRLNKVIAIERKFSK